MVNQWGTEPPTEGGYYWLRNYKQKGSEKPFYSEPTVVSVCGTVMAFFDAFDDERIRDWEGEWYGPIEPPKG